MFPYHSGTYILINYIIVDYVDKHNCLNSFFPVSHIDCLKLFVIISNAVGTSLST